jgi:hypothetical protein
LADIQKDTHLRPFRRQAALRLGSRAEQRLHGLLPTHSEGDQDGSRSPEPETTSRPLEHQLGHPGALAQRRARAQVPEALRSGALPPSRHRGLRGVVPGDVNQDRDGPGQCRLRCSNSSADIDDYQRFATWRHRQPSGQARFPAERKSAVRKRGPITQFVENQWPGIGPCGLARVPAGSCGKIRTPAGSRTFGELKSRSEGCGKPRTISRND